MTIHLKWIEPLSLIDKKIEVSTMVSGFSYTMLGFLAAVVAILFNFTETRKFKEYKKRKNLNIFISLYLVAIFCLVINAFLSLYNYSPRNTYYAFNLMLFLFTTTIVQVMLVTLAIFGIVHKATTQ